MNQSIDLTKLPLVDDSNLVGTSFQVYGRACIAVGNGLGVFTAFARKTPECEALHFESVAKKLDMDAGGVYAVCLTLVSFGAMAQTKPGYFHLTDWAQSYLVSDSPLYAGPPAGIIQDSFEYKKVEKTLKEGWAPIGSDNMSYTDMWKSGDISQEAADRFTDMMQATIFPSAIAEARSGVFSGTSHLVDVGGGSGALCMAVKAHQPETRTTLMDLAAVCKSATKHLEHFGFVDRVEKFPANFFVDSWPTDADGFHFSNIFHDWQPDVGRMLAEKSFSALPRNGKIFIHESFLDGDKTSPQTTVVFNLLMYLNHRAQQYTKNEMQKLLEDAGFIDIEVNHKFGIYETMIGKKP